MAIYKIEFTQGNAGFNRSVLKGDLLYYVNQEQWEVAGSNNPYAYMGDAFTTNSKPYKFGTIVEVNYRHRWIKVNNNLCSCDATTGAFDDTMWMFQKPRLINTSGITGYYAETEYRNYSTKAVEMFATAVDYTQSSK